MTDRFRLDGQVAVVTGASGGIGSAGALALAEAGADIALVVRWWSRPK
jgi:NAD(P)-dependent dehydrogenase (short-subunit alcohol dehydrogenase family)